MKVFKAAELSQLLKAFGGFTHFDGQAFQFRERVDQEPQLIGGGEVVSSQVWQRDVDEGWTRGSQKGEQLLHVLQHSFLLSVLHLDRLHAAAMLSEDLDEGLGGSGGHQHGRQKGESLPEGRGSVDCGM